MDILRQRINCKVFMNVRLNELDRLQHWPGQSCLYSGTWQVLFQMEQGLINRKGNGENRLFRLVKKLIERIEQLGINCLRITWLKDRRAILLNQMRNDLFTVASGKMKEQAVAGSRTPVMMGMNPINQHNFIFMNRVVFALKAKIQ